MKEAGVGGGGRGEVLPDEERSGVSGGGVCDDDLEVRVVLVENGV